LLTNLTIKNYALIDDLKVSFSSGFTTITGETGAGKSILLEGLSLVLGSRADRTALRDDTQKCVIEAHFRIEKYQLEALFRERDLDYDEQTILRREIYPNGKSRAFVNDSPVTLDILSELGARLIDVHSQHQTLQLAEHEFQLRVIDALAMNAEYLATYRAERENYITHTKALEVLQETRQLALKEKDYNTFLLDELEKIPLKSGMQEELEEQYEQLSNTETILEQLGQGYRLLNDEQMGITQMLRELRMAASRIVPYGKQYAGLHGRIESVLIELDDIAGEFSKAMEAVETDPGILQEVGDRLQQLYDLLKKHQVADVAELIEIKGRLGEEVHRTLQLDDAIEAEKKKQAAHKTAMEQQAEILRQRRSAVLPDLKSELEAILHPLGMPSATFELILSPGNDYARNGNDNLQFLFSANRGGIPAPLRKVASGGELSRIMLAIKSILVKYEPLPTMMFDEIDTGVSGEISNRMGDIMMQMSKNMQLFAITHLPQVASKGDHHYKVYKEEDGNVTHTRMRPLKGEERILELAEMLGGKSLPDSALAHARQLLN
jgi:DNA repair protein RecN (Recombination protein N)